MKKILFLICFLCSAPVIADEIETAKTNCSKLLGEPVVVGTKVYCKSTQLMNWWSAWSWCESLGSGMALIDLSVECPSYKSHNTCRELEEAGSDKVWSKNVMSSNDITAYGVNLSSGEVIGLNKSIKSSYAICR